MPKPKIVVTNDQDLSEEQKTRLNNLGNVTYYHTLPSGAEDYLARVKGADIICSGHAGLKDAYKHLRDVYITVSFVSVAFVDLEVLKSNGVVISNAPGVNRHAVSEWVFWMILTMMRGFPRFLNSDEDFRKDGELPPLTKGLVGKKITILGYGNIARQVGRLAEAFDMKVNYFKRGDDLNEKVKSADIVVDALSSNSTTKGMLASDFFMSLKKQSYFVSVARLDILDQQTLFEALDSGKLASAAFDLSQLPVGDTKDSDYQKFMRHPKILVTPHIAYNAEESMKFGNDVMIDNVEAYIKGKPINVLT